MCENKSEKIVKLDFNVDEPSSRVIKIISQAMYEAADVHALGLKSAAILYLDVPRGKVHRGARAGARLRHDIEAGCKNISAIWEQI